MAEEKTNVTNIGEAISVLVQGVNIAQSKGIYTFADSAKIASALDFINAAQAAATKKMEEENAAGPKSHAVNTVESDKSVETVEK
jgi:hypothetical protein